MGAFFIFICHVIDDRNVTFMMQNVVYKVLYPKWYKCGGLWKIYTRSGEVVEKIIRKIFSGKICSRGVC
jgi:hypothetical protein